MTKSNTIEKKKYLGRNDLIEFEVPEGVTVIGDWAFAQCEKLRTIRLPESIQEIGKCVFQDCPNLREVYLRTMPGEMSRIWAYAFTSFELMSAYSYQQLKVEEWLEDFDRQLDTYLDTVDDMDFAPFLAGGEEDYQDVNEARQEYMDARKEKKCSMVLERMLLHKQYEIEEKSLSYYMDYLKTEIDAVLRVLLQESEKAVQYYTLLDTWGIMDETLRENMLPMLDERHVELKAMILQKESDTSFKWDHFQL